jgi:nitronate monooxygenase
VPAPDLVSILGVSAPIIQAPMLGVSTPALAAAVSNAGGLGSIAIAAYSAETAKRLIDETRAMTSNPFNVNVFCFDAPKRDAAVETAWISYLRPLFAEIDAEPPAGLSAVYGRLGDNNDVREMLLEARPPVISFHFGLPEPEFVSALKAAGIRTIAAATNLEEAAAVERSGIDVIVAQGIEAGGHRGLFDLDGRDPGLSTSALVRLLARETRSPIVAAGGIMDGAGIRAALALGASGVQMGTAFILCPESAASENYRAALQSERAYDTRFTSAISGRPARGLVGPLTAVGAAPECPQIPDFPVAYDAAKRLDAAARAKGRYEFAPCWAGQGAPLVRELPAAELIAQLVREMSPEN